MQQVNQILIIPELRKRLNFYIRNGLSPLKKHEPIKLAEWADRYFYLSAESSSIEGHWETLPYQRSILNTVGNDDVREVTLFKSARVGYTKIICAAIGYNAEHKKRNQVVYQPTDTDARDFVSDEIDPMLRDVPVVRKLLKGDVEKKGKDNTKHRKAFRGSSLDIKGGKSARNYRRITKDIVYYDELDGFDMDVEGEGAPVSLGDTRITTSSFPKSVRGSTPGIEGMSQIQSSMDDADMVFRRYLPCPECEEYQYLKWSNIDWTNGDPKTTKYACEHCGSLIDYSQFPDMDAEGVWWTEDGCYLDDDDNFRNGKDKLIDPPYHAAFIIWSAYSYFTTWSELAAEFIKANTAKKKGDTTKLKTFINTKLGELWTDEGKTVESDAFIDRLENYGPEVPEGALILTCGVDIQDDRIEAEVIGWGIDAESWSVEYNIFVGDTSVDPVNKDSVWQQLDDYLLTRFTNETGVTMRIASACIDLGGHRAQHVYSFCMQRIRRRVFVIKGLSGAGRPITSRSRKSKKYSGTYIPVGVDAAKDLIFSNLKVKNPGPGYCHYPSHYTEQYFDQLTAEKCVTKNVRGKASRVWVLKSAGRRNEALDCRVYGRAALELLNVNMAQLEKRMDSAVQEKNQNTPAKSQRRHRRMISNGVKL